MPKDRLLDIVTEISEIIAGVMEVNGDVGVDMKAVKDVDKRLKMCSNPEKIPGTALYVFFQISSALTPHIVLTIQVYPAKTIERCGRSVRKSSKDAESSTRFERSGNGIWRCHFPCPRSER